MNISKNLLGTIAGTLIATVVAFGAVKFTGPDAVSATPAAVAVVEVTPAIAVVVVDPNQAAIQIQAPDAIKVGELAVLDVSGSNAESFAWKVKPETKNFMVIDGGRRAVFSAESAGEYLFFVSGAKGGTVDSQIHTITVAGNGGSGPAAPVAVDVASKVPVWIGKVESPTKRDEALKLAQSFSSIAAVITPNMTPSDIVQATIRSNRDALGSNIKSWEPFLIELQVELEARAADGSLKDSDSHVRMWRSISTALTAAAEKTPTSVKVSNSRGR